MYGIYARYYYFDGTLGAPEDGPLLEEDYNYMDGPDRLKFWTKEEAEEYLISEMDCHSYKDNNNHTRYAPSGTYYLTHGEYERPDYKIVKLKKR